MEGSSLAWAQGVGRSNRPAPTKPRADSKRVSRFGSHRFRHSFASTVPNCAKTRLRMALCCAKTRTDFVRVPVELRQRFPFHLQLHLRILLEHLCIALPEQLRNP